MAGTKLISTLLILCVSAQVAFSYHLVCYYGSWSVYRQGQGKFEVEDIDPFVCTHVIYTFVGLNTDGSVRLLDAWNDVGDEWHEGAFFKIIRLREKNPQLKLMLAIGGWNEGSAKYSDVAASPALRAKLIDSAVDMVKKYKFNGFDIDWEYPSQRGGKPEDKENYSALLREFRARFNREGLILSAAVSANPDIIDQAYEVPVLSENLDFINVMTYDIHGSWDKRTGHNAPLYQGPNDAEWYDIALGVDDAIRYWITAGSDPKKLNLGVASYGRSFTLQTANENGVGAPATGPGFAGNFVNEQGFLAYNEICYQQNQNLWTTHRDEVCRVPYAVKGNQWVGFDDPQSLTEKVELAKSLGLAGIMIWSIETDDFDNICGHGRYVLLNTIINALGGLDWEGGPTTTSTTSTSGSPNDTTTSSSTTTTTTTTTTTPVPPPPGDIVGRCNTDGQFIRDPEDCAKFYKCRQLAPGVFDVFTFYCEDGLLFDENLNICNYPELVQC